MDIHKIIEQYERARACLRMMKEAGIANDYKIGLIRDHSPWQAGFYNPEEVVLYHSETSGSNDRTVTVEQPLSLEWMMHNIKEGSPLTVRKTSGIPAKLIDEINPRV